ncbi:MAG: ABC transporter substrate-binding protein [Hyphomicrobiales bacterium]|nr:ABC transporter substrate-binding protein [Hyphomicrobiales bacterium]
MASGKIAGVKGFALGATLAIALTGGAQAQKKYDPGASDTEIKIGNIEAYSGPASAYGVIGKTEEAYFKMINDQGGINGRKINFISYDDGYSPPKTVEQARKLVESDEVLAIFNPLGTPTNISIIKYLNAKKMPHLFIAAGGTMFGNYKQYPWSMGWQPNYQSEGRIYAKYVLDNFPNAKIGILSANDDFGKDALKGFLDGLGDKAAKMIVEKTTYESSDATVDSQILKLKGSGADFFCNFSTPKFAAMAIKKIGELGWHPQQIVHSVSLSVGAVLKPAGLENAKGIVTAAYYKDPDDPAFKDDAGVKGWKEFLDKYMPGADKSNSNYVYGVMAAQTMVETLKKAGDNLTRENLLKAAESLDVELPMLLPGIKVTTGPHDHYPLKQMQMQKFDGERWVRFGPILKGEVTVD